MGPHLRKRLFPKHAEEAVVAMALLKASAHAKHEKVGSGEIRHSKKGETLYATQVSSCSVICLWDEKNKTSVMGHMLLGTDSYYEKFIDSALEKYQKNGGSMENLRATQVAGMYALTSTQPVEEVFKAKKIKLKHMETESGNVFFSPHKGKPTT